MWKKEKLLVTSNFSVSHSVFKRLVTQTRKNQGLFGKGLKYGDYYDLTHSQLFPKRQILDSSKLKEFADDNFKFDENGGEFYKWVQNTVEKGEIARDEQFLLFPQCFQKICIADT